MKINIEAQPTELLDSLRTCLKHYETILPSVEKITMLVLNNPEFFNAHIGDDCLAVAAMKLDDMVRYKQM